MLVSLVPLTLLGLALLGAFGLQDVWTNSLGPTIKARVTLPVYRGIDFSVKKIFAEDTIGLILVASALALWNISRGMRIVMKALNVIHDAKETRSGRRLVATDVALALAFVLCVNGAFLLVVTVPRLGGGTALRAQGWTLGGAGTGSTRSGSNVGSAPSASGRSAQVPRALLRRSISFRTSPADRGVP